MFNSARGARCKIRMPELALGTCLGMSSLALFFWTGHFLGGAGTFVRSIQPILQEICGCCPEPGVVIQDIQRSFILGNFELP